ncbi:MAG: hypothetical protein RIB43_08830 [Rhodospirillaceae bacterium]|jgi:hypothetical protein
MAAPASWADGAHAAFTVIEHNARAGTWEVIHRMMALDLEIALTARTGRVVKLENMTESEDLIASYLYDYFSLSSADDEPLPLIWVGAAAQMDMVLTYQETSAPEMLNSLVINNQILTDAHPTQVNTVNISYDGRIQTRIFTQNDGPQLIALD